MKYLHAINKISGVGPQKIKLLKNHFSDNQSIWEASASDLNASGLPPKLIEIMLVERKNINPDAEWEFLQKENIEIVSLDDPLYPAFLREIPNPPHIIYIKGQKEVLSTPMISVVGSRKYSSYGSQVAENFAYEIATAGITVVSGMAIGIDTFAHKGTLSANGKTIAVLGNSLDEKNIYPRNNCNLAREISQSGLLLSEYPPETKAGPLTFPARNRIVAGLSRGTLVVEAGEKSGALITAKMALDYNREVFSVPGSIYAPESIGTHMLIQQGAKLVMNVSNILEELPFNPEKKQLPLFRIPETETEKILLNVLSSAPIHIDNIAKLAKLETMAVSSSLSMLEIKGWVKNIGGQNYIII